MGQRVGKHHMHQGVKLYHERHHPEAIARWRSALARLRYVSSLDSLKLELSNVEDRFVTLGYLAQAFCEDDDFESMLRYSLQQMELANASDDAFMKSEALLNLSKAYERLADFSKAISYARASLQHPSMDSRTPGHAQLGESICWQRLPICAQ